MLRKKSPNGTGRVGRDKKKRALESDEYKLNIQQLTNMGVNTEDIQKIYDRCQERAQTKIARHTLASKLINLLEYFDRRNQTIPEESPAYISKDDVIEMIMKNPRIINSDIQNNVIIKCEVLTSKKEGDIKSTNMLIKSNPGVFRKTIRTIKEGR